MRIRSIHQVAEFLSPDDSPGLSDAIVEWFKGGDSSPEWCLIAEDEGQVIGRIGSRIEYTCDEDLRGDLPEYERHSFGFTAPWDDRPEIASALIEAANRLPGLPATWAWHIGADDPSASTKVETAQRLGATLFQEKVGFRWTADSAPSSGSPARLTRLTYRTLGEVGAETYAHALSQVAIGLDRESAWYAERMGAANWGRVMMEYADPEDADSWVLAYDGDDLIGQVAISAFDPEIADGTIAWVGVVPDARGKGYGADLLHAAPGICKTRGFASMLCDTDSLNVPMQQAFLRAGHEPDPLWHRWRFHFVN